MQSFAPVELPSDAGAVIHFASPGRDLPVLSTFGIGDPNVMAAMEQPSLMVSAFFGQAMARSVDLDRPLDAITPASKSVQSWSVALTPASPETLGELSLTRVAPARWAVALPESGRRPGPAHCELWHGAEPAGYRIVCGDSAERVERHGRYYLGAAGRLASSSNIRIEVPGAIYADAVRQAAEEEDDETEAERAATKMGKRMTEELFADQKSIALELRLKPQAVELSFEITFSSLRAPMALWWTGSAAPSQSMASAFFKLPGDADLAFYKSGADPTALRSAVDPFFTELIDGALEEYDVTAEQRREVERGFRGVIPSGGAFVFASGQRHDLLATTLAQTRVSKAGVDRPPTRKEAAPAIAALKRELGGWLLLGFEEDPKTYAAAMREFVRVVELDFPKKKPNPESDAKEAKKDPDRDKFRILAAPARLPRGTLYLKNEVRPNPKYEPPADGSKPPIIPYDVHVLVVPDGQRTWLSISQDFALALRQAERALSVSSGNELGKLPELRELAAKPPSAAGKTTLAGLAALGMKGDSDKERAETAHALKLLSSLPQQGRAPIPVWMEREGTSSRLVARLSPQAVAEIVQWMTSPDPPESSAP